MWREARPEFDRPPMWRWHLLWRRLWRCCGANWCSFCYCSQDAGPFSPLLFHLSIQDTASPHRQAYSAHSPVCCTSCSCRVRPQVRFHSVRIHNLTSASLQCVCCLVTRGHVCLREVHAHARERLQPVFHEPSGTRIPAVGPNLMSCETVVQHRSEAD